MYQLLYLLDLMLTPYVYTCSLSLYAYDYKEETYALRVSVNMNSRVDVMYIFVSKEKTILTNVKSGIVMVWFTY